MEPSLRDIQKIELGILNELDRICRMHGISYYLAQGTLLGAVREGGFIPWDDDIDVIMPYDDARRLVKIFPEYADEKYFITDISVEKYYPLMWKKIRAKNTLSRPKLYRNLPISWGICIDVFPFFPISNIKLIHRFEIGFYKFARKMLLAGMTKYEPDHNIITRAFELVPIPVRHFTARLAEKIMALHGDKTEYVYLTCRGGRITRRDVILGEKSEVRFEGNCYPSPANADTYLTEMFGDYMTPPPKSEQAGHDLKMGEIEWAYDPEDIM